MKENGGSCGVRHSCLLFSRLEVTPPTESVTRAAADTSGILHYDEQKEEYENDTLFYIE